MGYVTPASPGVIKASQRGIKLGVPNKWAHRLKIPCRQGVLVRSASGEYISSGPQVGRWAR